MKFSKLSQLFLVSSIGLLVATLLTACEIITIDYVFVASSAGSRKRRVTDRSTSSRPTPSPGALRTGAATVSSGGANPVAMAVTSDYANLYVANAGSNSIVHFAIGLDGGSDAEGIRFVLSAAPVAIAVNAAGTYLYGWLLEPIRSL